MHIYMCIYGYKQKYIPFFSTFAAPEFLLHSNSLRKHYRHINRPQHDNIYSGVVHVLIFFERNLIVLMNLIFFLHKPYKYND